MSCLFVVRQFPTAKITTQSNTDRQKDMFNIFSIDPAKKNLWQWPKQNDIFSYYHWKKIQKDMGQSDKLKKNKKGDTCMYGMKGPNDMTSCKNHTQKY